MMNSNLNISTGYRDILLRKIYLIVTSSVISQLVILLCYIALVNIDALHPLNWLSSIATTFTFISTWFFTILFIGITFGQCIVCAKDFVLNSTRPFSRFEKFLYILSMHNFLLLVLHFLLGGIFVWYLLLLVEGEYQYLIDKKEEDYYYLNKGAFLLIINGLWSGLYYYLKIYLASKHLTFPVIYQSKVFQLKNNIGIIFKDSFFSSITPTVYFSVLYTLFGDRLESQFAGIVNVVVEDEPKSFLLYLYCVWFCTLYFFSMNLMRFYFNLFLTQPVEFPLVKTTISLQEALALDNLPIIQKLACMDLYFLSQWSVQRRQIIFSLSQPGEHPHNWNSLVQTILKILNESTVVLNKSIVIPSSVARGAEHEIRPPVNMPPYPNHLKYGNLKNMSVYGSNEFLEQSPVYQAESLSLQLLKSRIKERFSRITARIDIIFQYFFGKLPLANIQSILDNGHVIIWASQGLSELVVASLKEDQYGVVQKDLPSIVSSLVSLKQAFDQLDKVSVSSKRIVIRNHFNYKMKKAIVLALRRSLFNICYNFRDYISYLPLEKNVVLYLQSDTMLKFNSSF